MDNGLIAIFFAEVEPVTMAFKTRLTVCSCRFMLLVENPETSKKKHAAVALSHA
jgi:hypothetical protein